MWSSDHLFSLIHLSGFSKRVSIWEIIETKQWGLRILLASSYESVYEKMALTDKKDTWLMGGCENELGKLKTVYRCAVEISTWKTLKKFIFKRCWPNLKVVCAHTHRNGGYVLQKCPKRPVNQLYFKYYQIWIWNKLVEHYDVVIGAFKRAKYPEQILKLKDHS